MKKQHREAEKPVDSESEGLSPGPASGISGWKILENSSPPAQLVSSSV